MTAHRDGIGLDIAALGSSAKFWIAIVLVVSALSFVCGCGGASPEVSPSNVAVIGINDGSLLLEIEGTRVTSETSPEIRKWMSVCLMAEGREPCPGVDKVYRTGCADAPYLVIVAGRSLMCSRREFGGP